MYTEKNKLTIVGNIYKRNAIYNPGKNLMFF